MQLPKSRGTVLSTSAQFRPRPFTILVVDDHPDSLTAVEAALASPEIKLLKARSGEEALRSLLHQPVDLILLDVRMTGMDGFETAEMIRARRQTAAIPIIFMSAIDKDDRQVFKGYQKGAVDYIFKPCNSNVLRAKISAFVELFRTTSELRIAEETVSQVNVQLSQSNLDLARTVEERNAELGRINDELRAEVEIRRQAEETVRLLNEELTVNMYRLQLVNKELEAFSYSISHELSAPLRRIQSFMMVILQDHGSELSGTARDYVERVCAASSQMSEMIKALLEISRYGIAPVKEEQVDLGSLAHEVIHNLKANLADRQLEFIIGQDLRAFGDKDLLKIALENLLDNAVKFTQCQESPRVELGTIVNSGEKIFYVRDNGAGFEQAYVDRLFRPFSRLHESSDFAGTGIGLTTVQRIIQRHGGRIWAEAEVSKGATFYFTLGQTN